MTRTHICGGTFLRSDIIGVFDPKRRRMMYQDLDPEAAHWKCTRCGATRTQRKRQPNLQNIPIRGIDGELKRKILEALYNG